jgi:S-adenosylmethionine:tRNA ribosyltransferase-isomerase
VTVPACGISAGRNRYDAPVRTDAFDFELPQELIAQHPAPRGTSRMMVLDRTSGSTAHREVSRLPELLRPDDLLLFNDTRVIPARLFARRPTGRTFELLLLRREDDANWQALLRPSARARTNDRLVLADGGTVVPVESEGEGRWRVRFEPALDLERLERLGEMPLPPYIHRPEGGADSDRTAYQTVYAANPGAVAAPTAGLHFTEELLDAVRAAGTETAFLTLHVGLGTFRPVQVDDIADHRMHEEWYGISPETAAAVNRTLDQGRRIVCVGTTSVRALEGALAAGEGRLQPGEGWTRIFITPGFEFRGTGAMLTNFHLPRSTLLMMISAFAGREHVLAAYAEAVAEGYRFFSYGDAMFIG